MCVTTCACNSCSNFQGYIRVVAMSVHHTFALDGQYSARRELVDAAQQHGAGVLYTTSIPADNYEEMLTEVLKLKPQKRENWKGVVTNNVGQKARVRYVEAGIEVPGYNCVSHFESKLSGRCNQSMALSRNGELSPQRVFPRLAPVSITP